MAFHILAHINAHERRLTVKKQHCQGLGGLGLSNPGWSHEEEATPRTVLWLEPGARPTYGPRHRTDSLRLAHDPLLQARLQIHELVPLPLQETGHGDAGPAMNHVCDVLRPHFLANRSPAFTLAPGPLHLQGIQFALQRGDDTVTQLGRSCEVCVTLRALFLTLGFFEARLELRQAVQLLLFLGPARTGAPSLLVKVREEPFHHL